MSPLDLPATDQRAASRRTLLLFAGFVTLIGLIVWPSMAGRIQYAKTRAELSAIRDAAAGAELKSVGKLFTTLARVIGPSVVNVTSKRRVHTLADEIAALRGEAMAGATDESVGSGVIVESDGVIITNYHVVSQSEEIDVALADGRRFKAELVGADAATDLAVLRIKATDLPKADWADSDTAEVGEMVWAIGNPFGLDRTITYGIVSAVGRRGVVANPFQEFLQTDASINPGNSGGPLVDVHGHVMGITTAIVGKGFRGIGFAIPSNTARRVCDEIRATGHVERGYLGMALRELPQGAAGPGAVVAAVEPQSPAAQAGVKTGDVVLRFDGEVITEPATLVLLLTRSPVGAAVPVKIIRDGEPMTITVRVGRRPHDT
ncbi:MAG: trypsin-like peptidase domain-containing protein [Planctomycetes bacterium]|nr:trypsin-like peptidase domain-containing protein [Planctomycetota bacterium]